MTDSKSEAEKRLGQLLTRWPALGQQELGHLPKQPSQRWGKGKHRRGVAGMWRKPLWGEALWSWWARVSPGPG